MHPYSRDYRTRPSGRSTVERVRAYLSSRSPEHWGFFAAGFVAALLLT